MLPDNIIIEAPKWDWVVASGIGGIAIIIAAVWVALFSYGNNKRTLTLTIFTLTVLVLSATLAFNGTLSNFNRFPPPMLIMFISMLLLGLWVGLSPFGREASSKILLIDLIGLQAFRLPLELFMHRASEVGIMPEELSFTGFNFDILTGAGALFIFLLLKFKCNLSKKVIWLWNIWGTLCLVAIAIIAITSSPMIRLFGDDPSHLNTWVLFFPYVWLPVILVSIAISSHIIIWRKLLMKGSKTNNNNQFHKG